MPFNAFAQGKVVFFAGGTGHPYFSTDTGVVLRAIEMEADVILLAKAIDGVYDSDPAKNQDAVKYDTVTIKEVVDKRLAVIDMTASIMCMENHMPLATYLSVIFWIFSSPSLRSSSVMSVDFSIFFKVSFASRRTLRTATFAASPFFLMSFTNSLRLSSVSSGNTRRMLVPSFVGVIPRSDARIAFSIAFNRLFSHGLIWMASLPISVQAVQIQIC